MKFITEDIIDQIITQLEAEPSDESIRALSSEQAPLIQFIASENFKLLKEEEFDVLIFLLTVIWKSSKEKKDIATVPAEAIEAQDEKNWAVINEIGNKNFAKVIDHYFEDYPQEDLLAFVEDTLAGEDSELTQVGKELLFVTAKTFIDCLESQ